jgi:hypothetical protein
MLEGIMTWFKYYKQKGEGAHVPSSLELHWCMFAMRESSNEHNGLFIVETLDGWLTPSILHHVVEKGTRPPLPYVFRTS